MRLSRRTVVTTALIAPLILRKADGNRTDYRFPPHSFTQLRATLV